MEESVATRLRMGKPTAHPVEGTTDPLRRHGERGDTAGKDRGGVETCGGASKKRGQSSQEPSKGRRAALAADSNQAVGASSAIHPRNTTHQCPIESGLSVLSDIVVWVVS